MMGRNLNTRTAFSGGYNTKKSKWNTKLSTSQWSKKRQWRIIIQLFVYWAIIYLFATNLLACLLLLLVTQNSIITVSRLEGTFSTWRTPWRLSHEKHWRSTTILIIPSTTLSSNTRKWEAWMRLPSRETNYWFSFSTNHRISRCHIAACWLRCTNKANWWHLWCRTAFRSDNWTHFAEQL